MGELIWSRVTGRTTQVFWTKPSEKLSKTLYSPSLEKTTPPAMKSVCLVLILAVTVSLGNALQCHVCNSNDDLTPDCNKYNDDGSFAGNYQTPCAEGETYCRKIYQMIRDEESVIRTCGKEEDTKDRDCYTTVLEEYNTEVCSCQEDLCNSATSVSAASVAASVLTAALAHLFGK